MNLEDQKQQGTINALGSVYAALCSLVTFLTINLAMAKPEFR